MALDQISAVIIARDAEATIGKCLRSLAGFAEIIVYANDCRDRTIEICREFANVRVIDGEFLGFGMTKNLAASHACNDWIVSLDADEWLDESLRAAMANTDLDDARQAFRVLRKNLFCGRYVRYGGWGNDWLIRLYNRNTSGYNEDIVHEKIVVGSGVATRPLSGSLWHDAIVRIDQFLTKTSYYSELAARDYAGKPTIHPGTALLRSAWAFVRSYVFQLGLLAGWRGVVIAFGACSGTFYKYTKRYARSRGFER